ncbi:ribonuclease M5 [Loigolactobacillus rennini DSM 20253]|uniref:Ribonuclease M5 n=3 Tax=Loigolactobacillus rennini TaxID=238013 RepID=A0A0R2D5E4_9LACO|nr:ribonuclease M5 [Loigolactobacillus rennini]KRM99342.1 ribonuclease M5 [Loigolactobacillus rennini DSM 20253]SFZ87372.1 Ribonuclease M5 [Loigolactobacillus rennini]
MKDKIKEVIVVEGRDDTKRLHEVLAADTIETNGAAIDQVVLNQIALAQEKRGVIVLTDPDVPGERIRHLIADAVPGVKQAFLPAKQAQPTQQHGSLGVEHASDQAILAALANLYTTATAATPVLISRQDLWRARLVVDEHAQQRRHRLGDLLHIGYPNGKQLYKRLQLFRITLATFKQAVAQVDREEALNDK